MYSNNQNLSRPVPGRKKRRDTFTANPSDVSSQPGVSPGRNKSRAGVSPGRKSTASPVGRRSVASPPGRSGVASPGRRSMARSPVSANSPPPRSSSAGRQSVASPGRRRKPKANSPTTSREFRSEEFKPRAARVPTASPHNNNNNNAFSSSRSEEFKPSRAPAPAVSKPSARPRPSRLSGFSLKCHVEGCDGGASCLHI
ncbi:unnamed protein product [Cylindrotheca closterium]|uniref:Uncharacterized protein n=1 Tax=Cylindrotheca closterium TaxID=2856 RepID=A0AAD2G5G1_9STRA|nr:unnamed protein product [Cylindrotheca closterium]